MQAVSTEDAPPHHHARRTFSQSTAASKYKWSRSVIVQEGRSSCPIDLWSKRKALKPHTNSQSPHLMAIVSTCHAVIQDPTSNRSTHFCFNACCSTRETKCVSSNNKLNYCIKHFFFTYLSSQTCGLSLTNYTPSTSPRSSTVQSTAVSSSIII